MRATIEPESNVAVAHLLTAAPDCDREELRVVAAACLLGDVIYARPPPARHHTIIHMLSGRGLGRGEQGFLINNGRFATRRQAADIAVRSGQLDHATASSRRICGDWTLRRQASGEPNIDTLTTFKDMLRF